MKFHKVIIEESEKKKNMSLFTFVSYYKNEEGGDT